MDIKEKFIEVVDKRIKRDGIGDLMNWLNQTDFFVAPASTRFHGAFEGGLALHSLNVYSWLNKMSEFFGIGCDDGFNSMEDIDESIAIVSLFHDICKVNCYKIDMRWRKDANNQWEQYATWKFNEDFAFGGHGSKSVYLVQNFIKLTPVEASAINCHMGAYDLSNYNNPSSVYERNMLAWMLHVADEADTYLKEDQI